MKSLRFVLAELLSRYPVVSWKKIRFEQKGLGFRPSLGFSKAAGCPAGQGAGQAGRVAGKAEQGVSAGQGRGNSTKTLRPRRSIKAAQTRPKLGTQTLDNFYTTLNPRPLTLEPPKLYPKR